GSVSGFHFLGEAMEHQHLHRVRIGHQGSAVDTGPQHPELLITGGGDEIERGAAAGSAGGAGRGTVRLGLLAALRHKSRSLGSIHWAPSKANKAGPPADQPAKTSVAMSPDLIYTSV